MFFSKKKNIYKKDAFGVFKAFINRINTLRGASSPICIFVVSERAFTPYFHEELLDIIRISKRAQEWTWYLHSVKLSTAWAFLLFGSQKMTMSENNVPKGQLDTELSTPAWRLLSRLTNKRSWQLKVSETLETG